MKVKLLYPVETQTVKRFSLTLSIGLILGLVLAAPVHASLMLQPNGITVDTGTVAGAPINTINQSGLQNSYVSLQNDFDVFLSGNPTHRSVINSAPAESNVWVGDTFPTVDFDLGGLFQVESLALWNYGNALGSGDLGSGGDPLPQSIRSFRLFASNDGFQSDTRPIGGLFSAVPVSSVTDSATGIQVDVLPQRFDFGAAVQASSIRMVVVENYGSPSVLATGFGEVAFGANVVPEPSTVAIWSLLGVMGFGLALWRKRR